MPSVRRRARQLAEGMAEPSDSSVIHMQALRRAIGAIAFLLPWVLVAGENVRDLLLKEPGQANRRFVELSISAYFHTGMREAFVGSLCAIAVFLLCYKGYQRWDILAARVAGSCALLVAVCPTREPSVEAGDTGEPVIDSATLFSSARAPDPRWVGDVHFAAAALLFATLAVMSLVLFTRSTAAVPTRQKTQRNRIYRTCGWVIIGCIAAVALGKLLLSDAFNRSSSYVFSLESLALLAFGVSWLTKSELIFADPAPSAAVPLAIAPEAPAESHDAERGADREPPGNG